VLVATVVGVGVEGRLVTVDVDTGAAAGVFVTVGTAVLVALLLHGLHRSLVVGYGDDLLPPKLSICVAPSGDASA
jgi:hypothetical protein